PPAAPADTSPEPTHAAPPAAPAEEPHAAAPATEPNDQKPSGKTAYESLEEEMANLLGRAPGKP
ncbi:hypothetical protein CH341_29205, partial [Rhodoplanes roseus]